MILIVTENDCDIETHREGLYYCLSQRMTMILFVTENGCGIACYRKWL